MEWIIGLISAVFGIFIFFIIFAAIFISLVIGLGLFILWIITIIDCVKRDDQNFAVGGSNAKLVWLLLLIFINNIVPIIYLLVIMQNKSKKAPVKKS